MAKTENARTPAISVLVPIYNVERYLDQCLRSIQAQTFTDLEVICINDGSTDGSKAIIESYVSADSRFRLLDKPNSGYGASMNLGLKLATGAYIGIVESDDFIEPDMYAVLHDLAIAHRTEITKANFWNYWSQPRPTDKYVELYPPAMCGRVIDPQAERDIFYLKPSIWSGLYLHSFLDDNDIRFLETPGASYQDFGFSTRGWISASRVWLVHDAYLHYRQDNEASSINNPGKVYCVRDEYAEAEAYLRDRPAKAAYLMPVLAKMRYDTYMWNIERIAPAFRPDFVHHMHEEFHRLTSEGTVDWALFEPWKADALHTLLESERRFLALLEARPGGSYARKAVHYLRTGGPIALGKVVLRKLRGRL